MPIMRMNNLAQNALGGTELQCIELEKRLDPQLLDKFQIWPSRVRTENIDNSKIQILWQHDLPGDPESAHLANGGYNKFKRIIFVSNWQMQAYINAYNIPWHKCAVVQNAINLFDGPHDYGDKINFIYHTTPHRGLTILVPVFEQLAKKFPDKVHLDVYSSFDVYGWPERNKPYEALFQRIKDHPDMTYHGTVGNDEIKNALLRSEVFAYPSIWSETSCIAMIEALSAGLAVVHPNLAALPETSANWTFMYQYQEDQRDHAEVFSNTLERLTAKLIEDRNFLAGNTFHQQLYYQSFYSWDRRILQWTTLLNALA